MDDAIDMLCPKPPRSPVERRWWGSLRFRVSLAAAGLALAYGTAWAQQQRVTWQRCDPPGASTMTVGGTAQPEPPAGAVPSVKGIFIQNPSTASESLFVDSAGSAATTAGVSPELPPGAYIAFGPDTVPFGKVTVNAATTAHAFVCQYSQ